MLRVFYLFWTLIVSLLVTSFSFFYVSEEIKHGFPFTFAKSVENGVNGVNGVNGGEVLLKFNVWTLLFDILFWWLLFSILLIIVKNYVFESD